MRTRALLVLAFLIGGCSQEPSRPFKITDVSPSNSLSTIRFDKTTAIAGAETITATVTLYSGSGFPLTGATPTLIVSGTNNTVLCGTSNGLGVSVCTIQSTHTESKTVAVTSPVVLSGGTVTFTHGVASQVVFTTQPSGGVAGVVWAQQPVAEIRDAYGNLVTTGVDATASVSAALTTGAGILSGTPSISAVAGVATFTNLSIQLIGSKNLTVTKADTTGSGGTAQASVISSAFTITAAAVSDVTSTITGTGPVVADSVATSNITITLKDVYSNPVAGSTPTFNATDTGSTNVYSACSVSNASGVSACTLTSKRVETKTLSILTPVVLSGGTVTFTHGPASQIVLTTQPGGGVAGVVWAQQPVAEIQDAYGNLVTTGVDATASVSAAISTGTGVLSGTSPVSAIGGVVTFTDFLINFIGSKNLTITKTDTTGSGGTVSRSVVSNAFTITVGGASASTSTITGTGPTVANGVATSTVSITLLDAASNPISGVTPTFSATDTLSKNAYGLCSATNASGLSTCTLLSTYGETKTLSISSPISKSDGTVFFSSNFQVPIEMVNDILNSSDLTINDFQQTQTSLNTSRYSGVSTSYYFEVIAANQNVTNDYNVSLIDSGNVVLATILVPANTLSATRFTRVSFTPNSGNDVYRIRLDQTENASDLSVNTVRIWVDQQGATSTRIYVPLLSRSDSTNAISYTQNNAAIYSYWNLNLAEYQNLLAGNPWSLETVMSSSDSSGFVNAALYNVTAGGAFVSDSVTFAGGTAIQLVSQSFSSGANNFTDGADFEVRFQSSDVLYTADLYRAGIWVDVTNPEKLMIPIRVGTFKSDSSSSILSESRVLWTPGAYTAPQVFFEAVGFNTVSAGGSIRLFDHQAQDSGTSGGAGDVTLSSVDWAGTAKQRLRTGSLSLTAGNRFLTRRVRTAGAVSLSDAKLWIGVGQ